MARQWQDYCLFDSAGLSLVIKTWLLSLSLFSFGKDNQNFWWVASKKNKNKNVATAAPSVTAQFQAGRRERSRTNCEVSFYKKGKNLPETPQQTSDWHDCVTFMYSGGSETKPASRMKARKKERRRIQQLSKPITVRPTAVLQVE